MRIISAVVILFSLAQAQQPQKKEIKGTVLLPDGVPAVAEVATSWMISADPVPGGPSDPQRTLAPSHIKSETGEKGSFALTLTWFGRPLALFAIDKDRRLGAAAMLTAENVDQPIELRLKPLVAVKATLVPKEGKPEPRSVNVSVRPPGAMSPVLSEAPSGDAVELRLPPGEWQLAASNIFHWKTSGRKFTVSEGQTVVDLGAIEIEPTPLWKMIGSVPPSLKVSDARGVSKGVSLEDYKGRWVLMEFWGYW